jgi:hypothetical protein
MRVCCARRRGKPSATLCSGIGGGHRPPLQICVAMRIGYSVEGVFYMRLRLIGLVVALGLFASANGFGVTARDLLASPFQGQRDLGAQILRGAYVAPPRANWDVFVKRLKPGMKRAEAENVLRSVNAVPGGGGGMGTWETYEYRLDDLWVVNCSFTNSVLSDAQINEEMNAFRILPPANFTGDWVTYWANGQRSDVRHYQDGKQEGIGTSFFPDGVSQAVICSFRNGVEDGEETGYFKSGKIHYKGRYKAGKQIGHWVWYKEDGTVESEKDFGK